MKPAPTKVWVVRHPRVVAEVGLCFGRFALPLADTFPEEVAAIRGRLPWAPEAVWTSPSVACQRTAIALGGVVHLDDRLWELDFGEWEGRSWGSFDGPECEAWVRDPWKLRPPGGESGEAMERRIDGVRQDILRSAMGRRVVVVTHGGVLRMWRRLAESVSRSGAVDWSVPYGAAWELG